MNNIKTRNKLFTLLLLVMALLIPQWGWAQEIRKPSVGDGSTGNPYEISTAAELAWFRTYVNEGNLSVCAKLTDNIDLKYFCHAADASNNIEKSWEPIGSYDSYPIKHIKVYLMAMDILSATYILKSNEKVLASLVVQVVLLKTSPLIMHR